MNREIKIDDRTYTVAPLRFGQARDIFSPGKDPFDANCEMVAACLNNAAVARVRRGGPAGPADTTNDITECWTPACLCGGSTGQPIASQPAPSAAAERATWTPDDVKDLAYPDGRALMDACLEINGLKSMGEEKAAQ